MDNHRQNLVAFHLALRADMHLAGHGQPVHSGIEAADAIRKGLWQHWHHPVYQVHTGAPGLSLHIQRLPLPDIPAHIGNIYPQEEAAIVFFLYIDAIIQILGILTVNGDDFQMATILPALEAYIFISINGLRHCIRCLLDSLREGLGQIILPHNGKDIHSWITFLAQHLHDFPFSL